MSNKFVTALKTNENNFRKKVLIATGITVAAVAAGVVLTKMNADLKEVIIVAPSDVVEVITDSAPTE